MIEPYEKQKSNCHNVNLVTLWSRWSVHHEIILVSVWDWDGNVVHFEVITRVKARRHQNQAKNVWLRSRSFPIWELVRCEMEWESQASMYELILLRGWCSLWLYRPDTIYYVDSWEVSDNPRRLTSRGDWREAHLASTSFTHSLPLFHGMLRDPWDIWAKWVILGIDKLKYISVYYLKPLNKLGLMKLFHNFKYIQ